MADFTLSPRTSALHAGFASSAEMQRAIDTLVINGFDHADVALIDVESRDVESRDSEIWHEPIPHDRDTQAAFGDADARQARTLQASGAATAAGLAAAGITVATGGLAAVAVGAAVIAGVAAGGLTHAVSTAVNQAEQSERDGRAAEGRLVLSVQVPTEEKRARAESILRQAGARDICIV